MGWNSDHSHQPDGFLRKDYFLRRFRQILVSALPSEASDGLGLREPDLDELYDIGTELGIDTDRAMQGFLSICITSDAPEFIISAVNMYLQQAGGDADSVVEGLLHVLEERGREIFDTAG